MKKVSVVVPCYNASMYLDKCIQHLLHQTIGLENMEIILVNDASRDEGKTWDLITKYEQNYPDVIMAINLEQNLRQGGARNVGVSYASGEYLIFCDADDWLLEETLEHCYQAAKKYDVDVVEFRIKYVEDRDISITLEKGGENQFIELDTEEKRKVYLMKVTRELSYGSQAKLYRLSLLQENHIVFAEHLIFEEPSFALPVRLYEKKHYFLDEWLYISYLSEGSTIRGDWENDHKWDNPQVWLILMEDLEKRGFLQKYYQELEYVFFRWGLGLSIRMPLHKGYFVTKEELQFIVDMTLQLFPDIKQNKYIKHDGDLGSRDRLLLQLLSMDITDESAKIANEVLCYT